MPVSALSGPQYLREGLRLVLSPGLRLFLLLPLTINVLLFAGLLARGRASESLQLAASSLLQ